MVKYCRIAMRSESNKKQESSNCSDLKNSKSRPYHRNGNWYLYFHLKFVSIEMQALDLRLALELSEQLKSRFYKYDMHSLVFFQIKSNKLMPYKLMKLGTYIGMFLLFRKALAKGLCLIFKDVICSF